MYVVSHLGIRFWLTVKNSLKTENRYKKLKQYKQYKNHLKSQNEIHN